jgi:hypothetical protein
MQVPVKTEVEKEGVVATCSRCCPQPNTLPHASIPTSIWWTNGEMTCVVCICTVIYSHILAHMQHIPKPAIQVPVKTEVEKEGVVATCSRCCPQPNTLPYASIPTSIWWTNGEMTCVVCICTVIYSHILAHMRIYPNRPCRYLSREKYKKREL